MYAQNHHPDGLTEQAIDVLLAEVDAEARPVRRSTAPFAGSLHRRPLHVVRAPIAAAVPGNEAA
ncbi:hypothetical protein [Pseudonocardia sp. N23]|uniref:hypothetical protein n=1 Tax=Pseudonocardia sp. N23 TaxID=1987376 RepID=UPI000BFD6F41|nr:hypothetical protein [Pseudonocardia sp. N23]GAY11768.1 hypothetical protein TOK_0151 [Pseudonocardia sp. N23]